MEAPSKRTRCSHTQPGPKHDPFSNRRRIGSNTYKGSPHALKRPHWPANPPSTLLPPTPPVADQPLAPFSAPPPPLWATPPAASDAPASPVPLALALVPPALRCSMPTPTPPSPPVPCLDPPLPVEAPPPMPSMLPLAPPPVTTRPLNPCTSPINPPNPQKTPDALLNFRPCPTPILANSNASPANSDSPLANFGAFPAATDTYPGSPKPREPPPLFPIFATHHQLNTLVPPTHSGVSQQPRGDPCSPIIPSTYQRSPILDCN
ncbi:Filamentous hemagglutinin [Termitomyces sp. J132]|nr:Filamentous hemagglutinin [Termitomyces sp. J132]